MSASSSLKKVSQKRLSFKQQFDLIHKQKSCKDKTLESFVQHYQTQINQRKSFTFNIIRSFFHLAAFCQIFSSLLITENKCVLCDSARGRFLCITFQAKIQRCFLSIFPLFLIFKNTEIVRSSILKKRGFRPDIPLAIFRINPKNRQQAQFNLSKNLSFLIVFLRNIQSNESML